MATARIVPYIESADFDAMKAFYVGVLGLEVAMEEPGSAFLGLASPDNRSAQILVAAVAAGQSLPRLGIDVGDAAAVDRVLAAAIEAGSEVVYPVTDEPWGIRRFFVRDPSGAVVSILGHL